MNMRLKAVLSWRIITILFLLLPIFLEAKSLTEEKVLGKYFQAHQFTLGLGGNEDIKICCLEFTFTAKPTKDDGMIILLEAWHQSWIVVKLNSDLEKEWAKEIEFGTIERKKEEWIDITFVYYTVIQDRVLLSIVAQDKPSNKLARVDTYYSRVILLFIMLDENGEIMWEKRAGPFDNFIDDSFDGAIRTFHKEGFKDRDVLFIQSFTKWERSISADTAKYKVSKYLSLININSETGEFNWSKFVPNHENLAEEENVKMHESSSSFSLLLSPSDSRSIEFSIKKENEKSPPKWNRPEWLFEMIYNTTDRVEPPKEVFFNLATGRIEKYNLFPHEEEEEEDMDSYEMVRLSKRGKPDNHYYTRKWKEEESSDHADENMNRPVAHTFQKVDLSGEVKWSKDIRLRADNLYPMWPDVVFVEEDGIILLMEAHRDYQAKDIPKPLATHSAYDENEMDYAVTVHEHFIILRISSEGQLMWITSYRIELPEDHLNMLVPHKFNQIFKQKDGGYRVLLSVKNGFHTLKGAENDPFPNYGYLLFSIDSEGEGPCSSKEFEELIGFVDTDVYARSQHVDTPEDIGVVVENGFVDEITDEDFVKKIRFRINEKDPYDDNDTFIRLEDYCPVKKSNIFPYVLIVCGLLCVLLVVIIAFLCLLKVFWGIYSERNFGEKGLVPEMTTESSDQGESSIESFASSDDTIGITESSVDENNM